MSAMKKAELVDAIAQRVNGVTKKDIEAVLGALGETVVENVGRGTTVPLPGLGKFNRLERAARRGRNPATGEVIQVPASRVPSFKASKPFKDRVNR